MSDFIGLLEKELKEWVFSFGLMDVTVIGDGLLAVVERQLEVLDGYNYLWVSADGECEFYVMGYHTPNAVLRVDWSDPRSFDKLRDFMCVNFKSFQGGNRG